MKYGYGNTLEGELIQNYKISCDKIVITYLDGNFDVIPLTKENEEDLLNQMIMQAQDRSQSSALSKAKKERDRAQLHACLELLNVLLFGAVVVVSDSKIQKMYSIIFGCIFCLRFVKHQKIGDFKADEVEELEKYDIYLSMREALEEYIEDPNLFKGINAREEELNINTLDDYSLKEIKTVQKNLRRVRRK